MILGSPGTLVSRSPRSARRIRAIFAPESLVVSGAISHACENREIAPDTTNESGAITGKIRRVERRELLTNAPIQPRIIAVAAGGRRWRAVPQSSDRWLRWSERAEP